jgi:O-antigen ligase
VDDTSKAKTPILTVENIATGDTSSWISTIIFVMLCFVPAFAAVMFGGVDNTTWMIIFLFWVGIILLWLAESWKANGFLYNSSALQLPILGLILIGLVQLLPFELVRSIEQYSTRLFTIRLIVLFVFFAACLTFINSERRLKTAAYFVVIFGAAMGFFGILQWLGDPDGIYGLRETPQAISFGPFVNQHHFAAFMEMTGGVTFGLLLEKTKGRERKLLLAAALVVMGVAAALTSSRGGMLGFAAMLAFVTIMNVISRRQANKEKSPAETRRLIAIAVCGVALLIVIFGLALLLGGNESVLRGIGAERANVDISNGRFHFWPVAVKIFLAHPLLGAGFDAFGVAFTRYDTWNGFFRVDQAHNDYLQMLADAGIAGFACIAAFIYLLFRKGLRVVTTSHGFRKSAAIGALAGCLGVLVHSFFDFPLRTPSNAFFFLLLAAIATVPIAAKKQRPASAP